MTSKIGSAPPRHPSQEPVHIAFCVDDKYVGPMVVTAKSVQANMASPGRALTFHVIDGGFTDEGCRTAVEALSQYGEAHFYRVENPLRLPDWHMTRNPAYSWWTSANLRRLHIADVLPDSVHRVLYLDADTLAVEDVSPLYDVALDGRCLGAVENDRAPGYWPTVLSAVGDRREHSRYFNAGVLVLDLLLWRQRDISSRAAKFYERHQRDLPSLDQDTLNILLDEQWMAVDPKWNRLVQRRKDDPFGLDIMDLLDTDEGIVHFGGRIKPWHDEYPDTPLRRRYRAHQ